ncbi:hypothetical protein [Nocardia macrotermitis]|uniref:Uncharacterized protein n=1 Tax=Nocardia macrotermitis TaxID=2585198 RepID=A0A7K0DA35_9NOCA|nr:hypothetical protein [Nocardia macrotermitis]MQY22636.1 hypothetical protein [Nocardia macrotermitis]
MLNLNAASCVSGGLSFSHRNRNEDTGNPSNKPIPVIEVPSTGVQQNDDVYVTR